MKRFFEEMNSRDKEFIPTVKESAKELFLLILMLATMAGMGVLSCLI